MASRLLLVDDDHQVCVSLGRYFAENRFAVETVHDGESISDELAFGEYELVLLDVSLQREDSMALCRRLRVANSVPIVMLSSQSGAIDRVTGLELGADDYVCRPFDPRESLARIRAIMRRSSDAAGGSGRKALSIYEFPEWRLDRARRTLRNIATGLVDLTADEFDLLVAFVEHAQRVVTRANLLDVSRGQQKNAFDRRIDVLVSRPRRRLYLRGSGSKTRPGKPGVTDRNTPERRRAPASRIALPTLAAIGAAWRSGSVTLVPRPAPMTPIFSDHWVFAGSIPITGDRVNPSPQGGRVHVIRNGQTASH